jgi:predicted S18 family serine protease
MSTPIWAPWPVLATRAVDVARPRAQGQAMISTETAAPNASWLERPAMSHPARVATARAMTTGTNTADTRSASRCTGALPAGAAAAIRVIWP